MQRLSTKRSAVCARPAHVVNNTARNTEKKRDLVDDVVPCLLLFVPKRGCGGVRVSSVSRNGRKEWGGGEKRS